MARFATLVLSVAALPFVSVACGDGSSSPTGETGVTPAMGGAAGSGGTSSNGGSSAAGKVGAGGAPGGHGGASPTGAGGSAGSLGGAAGTTAGAAGSGGDAGGNPGGAGDGGTAGAGGDGVSGQAGAGGEPGGSGGTGASGAGGATLGGSCADADATWVFDAFGTETDYFNPGFRRRRIWGTSPTDVWVAGPGEVEAWHFDGSNWQKPASFVATKGFFPYEIRGSSASSILVLSADGAAARFDGMAWTVSATPALPAAASAASDSAGMDLIAGQGGQIWHIPESTAGGSQLLFTADPQTPLYGVSANGLGDVFAVGGGAAVMHLGSTGWQLVPPPKGFNSDWYDVAHIGKDLAFAVGGSFSDGGGMSGGIARITPTDQTLETIPDAGVSWAMVGIYAASDTDVYAVNASTLLHYDGVTWSSRMLPGQAQSWVEPRAAEAIWGFGTKDVFVAATDGVWRCHLP